MPAKFKFNATISHQLTLPATVEHSLSKLNLKKNKLHSICEEERLSELLLLTIDKDVPVSHSDLIDIVVTWPTKSCCNATKSFYNNSIQSHPLIVEMNATL